MNLRKLDEKETTMSRFFIGVEIPQMLHPLDVDCKSPRDIEKEIEGSKHLAVFWDKSSWYSQTPYLGWSTVIESGPECERFRKWYDSCPPDLAIDIQEVLHLETPPELHIYTYREH